jgi:hypothetical protein
MAMEKTSATSWQDIFKWYPNYKTANTQNTRRVAYFLLSVLSTESKKNITLCALRVSSAAGGEHTENLR